MMTLNVIEEILYMFDRFVCIAFAPLMLRLAYTVGA